MDAREGRRHVLPLGPVDHDRRRGGRARPPATRHVNGALRQDSRTSDLIFGPQAIVEFLAEAITLEPGDLDPHGHAERRRAGDGPAPVPRGRATSCAARSRAWVRSSTASADERGVQDIALSGVIGALSYALDITEGQPAGHAVRSCMIGMRMAEELDLPSRMRSDLFYALLLKDAGLLGQRRADGRAVRRRRPGREAHVQGGRLVAPAPGLPVVVADGRAGRFAARPRCATSRASRTRARSPRPDGGALRPRRGDRAHALPLRGDRRRDPQPRRALGRLRPARRPARRGDPAARAHPLPGPDGRDLPCVGRRQGRAHDGAAPPRALVRPGAGRRPASGSAATPRSGAAWTRPTSRAGSRPTCCSSPTTTGSTGSRRRSPA